MIIVGYSIQELYHTANRNGIKQLSTDTIPFTWASQMKDALKNIASSYIDIMHAYKNMTMKQWTSNLHLVLFQYAFKLGAAWSWGFMKRSFI